MPTQKNRVEEIDIRLRDFQEITLFTTRDGRPLPPIHAKVSFLKENDWKPASAQTATVIDDFLSSHKTFSSSEETSVFAEDIFKNHKSIVSSYLSKKQPVSIKKNESQPNSPQSDIEGSPSLPDGSETIDDLFQK